jgi:hypothetical protein
MTSVRPVRPSSAVAQEAAGTAPARSLLLIEQSSDVLKFPLPEEGTHCIFIHFPIYILKKVTFMSDIEEGNISCHMAAIGAEHVARMGEEGNAYRVSGRNH